MGEVLIKLGVGSVKSLKPEIWCVLHQVSNLWGEEPCVITSTTEGNHIPWSKHYIGLAIDIRKPLVDTNKKVSRLKEVINDNVYDIVEYDTHIHIEYDPK